VIAERTSVLAADVERLKREKHDCPDAEQRAELSQKLAVAEAAYVKALQVALNDVLRRPLPRSEVCRRCWAAKWWSPVTRLSGIWCRTTCSSSADRAASGEDRGDGDGRGKTLVATLPLY